MAGSTVSPGVRSWDATTATFDSLSPATGEVLATYQVDGEREVAHAVRRAQAAAAWWGGLSFAERRLRLLAWKSGLTRYLPRLAQAVHEETGKPLDDATLEVVSAILHLDWAARHARDVLRPRRVPTGLLMYNQAASVEYHPLGVVGVIGPWNYPVFTPMGSIAYALAAGNAVVFKPSELTTGVGLLLADTLADTLTELFGDDEPVLQVVTGLGETGAALARSAVQKVAFTGSPGTARKVMAAAAENLTPVLVEGGGKDALLVAADADLDAAADAAAWGAMSNAGQTCVGVERVYVVESVYPAFLDKLQARVAGLRPGEDAGAAYGPMTLPGQSDVVERHLRDAVARGGRPLAGGLDAVRKPFVDPVILVDVPEDSEAVREETFGPTVTVTPVPSLADGVRLANASRYALGSAVFTRSRRAGMTAARSLRAGMTSVNSVVGFVAVPALPFGGSGESGFGRIHGPDGLREFSRAKSITRQRMRPPVATTTFQRTGKDLDRLVTIVTLLHGRLYKPRRRR
ncbi:MAG TPA: aldehyde dehydrogenase family protein [Trebonia sp.]|jgi:acyl-CoA reductase-like NAD-dependent aldehyde dehydrogenase|nr:aldehyde dehydrogenase family protein [Trebonia sp.]